MKMKTELRLSDHQVLPGAKVVELWHDGLFIGQVVGADGPGVRIVSKYLTNNSEDIVIVVEPIPVLEVKLRHPRRG
jgi:hypothetical protein